MLDDAKRGCSRRRGVNLPIGVDELGEFSLAERTLAAGDLIRCYTDALNESVDAAGEPLDVGGLRRRLAAMDVAGPARLIPALLADLRQLHPADLAKDDVHVPAAPRRRHPASDAAAQPARQPLPGARRRVRYRHAVGASPAARRVIRRLTARIANVGRRCDRTPVPVFDVRLDRATAAINVTTPSTAGRFATSAPLAPRAADASAGARAIAAAFEPVADRARAEAAVRTLAYGHYENFSVVSRLVPRGVRQDFCNLYAFCRTADDLGDELGDRDASLRALARLRDGVAHCYAGRPVGAVFTALTGTIERHTIPAEPLLDLISAFEQDQLVTRYQTFDDLLNYCRRSADPVGRLVLYVCGYRDAARQQLSDQTCSALQLTNFWQDVRRDMDGLDRIYLPADAMAEFGVTEAQIRGGIVTENYRSLLRHLVERTETMFAAGDALLPMLSRPVAAQIGLFARGGRAILGAIRAQDYDTLSRRPTLSRARKSLLVAQALVARALTSTLGIGGRA